MKSKLNPKSLGYSLATLSALGMLALGIAANRGIYVIAAEQMIKWHLFFSLSPTGIITGTIEATIWGFIMGWLIAYFYNKFQK
tara:strand:- start:481 stop:729 length:249 start_codon:yes stop_codon:yes gene_type:complete